MSQTMFNTNIQTQTLLVEGKYFSKDLLPEGSTPIMEDLRDFLTEWYNEDEFFTVYTSGSTGKPKALKVKKEQMMQSACLTCSFFKLMSEDKVLLCMPLTYIAGKMMLVRALVGKLNLYVVQPSGHPLADTSVVFRFAPMIPLQVFNSLQIPEERSRLERIEILLLGGGLIDPFLEKELRLFPNAVYISYGMTETLSHIALRRINGSESSRYYTPLSSVSLSLSSDETLIIDAPLICSNKLYTNDRAIIHSDGHFEILGRIDNVVNSGGIKIQIEQVEETLRSLLFSPFAITSVPHPKFGEALILLIKGTICLKKLQLGMNSLLPSYQMPKQVIEVDDIPLTTSGKINRPAVRQLAMKLIDYSILT